MSFSDMGSASRSEILIAILKVAVVSFSSFITVKWMMQQLDPTNKRKRDAAKKAEQIFSKLGIKASESFSEYELMIASHLMDPSEIHVTWSSIGGLKEVIREIKETVILPIQRRDLFSDSMLTRPPKGVLLHGPPGCGKTMIAKATAKEAGCRFINLDVSILTDKWYGESQKLAAAVFSLAVKLQPCIIFIDEIDSFLRSRNSRDHEATAMMKAQFMTLWDGLSTDPDCTVIVMGATNRPSDLDKAILRRMPAVFNISLPDETQRKEILHLILSSEKQDYSLNPQSLKDFAKRCEGLSGSDLLELCRNASMYRVRDFISSNYRTSVSGEMEKIQHSLSDDQEQYSDSLRPMTLNDLNQSLKKMVECKVAASGLNLD